MVFGRIHKWYIQKRSKSDPLYFIEKVLGVPLTKYEKDYICRINEDKHTIAYDNTSIATLLYIVHQAIFIPGTTIVISGINDLRDNTVMSSAFASIPPWAASPPYITTHKIVLGNNSRIISHPTL